MYGKIHQHEHNSIFNGRRGHTTASVGMGQEKDDYQWFLHSPLYLTNFLDLLLTSIIYVYVKGFPHGLENLEK